MGYYSANAIRAQQIILTMLLQLGGDQKLTKKKTSSNRIKCKPLNNGAKVISSFSLWLLSYRNPPLQTRSSPSCLATPQAFSRITPFLLQNFPSHHYQHFVHPSKADVGSVGGWMNGF